MYITVVISNPKMPWLDFMKLKCLVDGSSLMLSISQKIASLLQLKELEKRKIITHDSRKIIVPYVGPIKMDFEGRSCFACAFVWGEEPMLGAVRLSEAEFIFQKYQPDVQLNVLRTYAMH